MRRRTLLRWIASLGVAIRSRGLRAWARTFSFPGGQAATLAWLAAIVLPSELASDGIRATTQSFEGWVREYSRGAEMDHGYGFPLMPDAGCTNGTLTFGALALCRIGYHFRSPG